MGVDIEFEISGTAGDLKKPFDSFVEVMLIRIFSQISSVASMEI